MSEPTPKSKRQVGQSGLAAETTNTTSASGRSRRMVSKGGPTTAGLRALGHEGGYADQAQALAPGLQPGVDPRQAMGLQAEIRNILDGALENVTVRIPEERASAVRDFRGDLFDHLDHDAEPSLVASLVATALGILTGRLVGMFAVKALEWGEKLADAVGGLAGSAVEQEILGVLGTFAGRDLGPALFIEANRKGLVLEGIRVGHATSDVFSLLPSFVGAEGKAAALAFRACTDKALHEAHSLQYANIVGQWAELQAAPRWRRGRLDKSPEGVLSLEVNAGGERR